jgi:ADP-dependent NAD(P)H-hydrate dehydratase / NAD(P)H-hydrate epimerase
MKIVSAAEMRQIDHNTTERYAVPSLTLMESAGTAVAEFALQHYPTAKTITILCGKGNNGGDGFVAARKLHQAGKQVQILLLADPSQLTGDAAAMFQKLPLKAVTATSAATLQATPVQALFRAHLFIDAILGTGFQPPVKGVYADAIAALNQRTAPIIAVDIPSGADADAEFQNSSTIARADAIVTFTAPRPAHVFSAMTKGPIIIAPIGSPEEAVTSDLKLHLTTSKEVAALTGPRPVESNKGNYGHVLIVGGSMGKAGAAAMSAMAALRIGAGLATVATPLSVLNTVAGFAPELMTEALADTNIGTIGMRSFEFGLMDSLTEGKRAIAIGPGLGRHQETQEFVRTCVERYRGPLILDADALNAFQGATERLTGYGRHVILTPHPGEMARLLGSTVEAVQKDRLNLARSFAIEHHVTVVLKGHRTLVVHPDGNAWVNSTGNPGMATGGTGDILTGIVAGLVAQNSEHVFEAVVAAVFLHGLAGDAARDSVGEYSLTATDLITALPEAFRRVHTTAVNATNVQIGA